MLLLFLFSFLLVLGSSYYFASVIKTKAVGNSIIYLILITLSQVIISIEGLSLVGKVNPICLLAVNFVVFVVSGIIWNANNKPHMDFTGIFRLKNRIINALVKDKLLLVLSIFFISSCLISLFLTIAVPSNSWDGLVYHMARVGFWVQNQTINHFETASIRQTAFPINSEILILWPMIFLKRDYLAIFPEYLAYLGCISLVFVYLSYLKFSTRRILWTILILASLPALIIESSSTQTNLIMGFLLLCSLYLFIYGAREKDKSALFFSAISYAIALGTKTTAILFLPVFGTIYTLISVKEEKKSFYKPLISFLLTLIPAFIILSAYNYLLNFIDFDNIFSPKSLIIKHYSAFGIKSFEASLIRYVLILVDFTGMSFAKGLSPVFMGIKTQLFSILNLGYHDGLAYRDVFAMNTLIHENYSTFGLIGFLIFIPAVFFAVRKINLSKDKRFYLALNGLIFLCFPLILSTFLGFCLWYTRYFVTAIILGAPILAMIYTKRKNFLKIAVAALVIYNYSVIPVFNASRPLPDVCKILNTASRNELRLRNDEDFSSTNSLYLLLKTLHSAAPDGARIALLFSENDGYYPFFEENPTWKIHSLRYENLYRKKNYDDYDFIVFMGEKQVGYVMNKKQIFYNYTIKGHQLMYNYTNEDMPVTIFSNSSGIPEVSKNPVFMGTIFDFSRLPKNFKLINNPEAIPQFTFYIYQNTKPSLWK